MDWDYGCYIGELGIIVCNGVCDGILLGELYDLICFFFNFLVRMEEKVEFVVIN